MEIQNEVHTDIDSWLLVLGSLAMVFAMTFDEPRKEAQLDKPSNPLSRR